MKRKILCITIILITVLLVPSITFFIKDYSQIKEEQSVGESYSEEEMPLKSLNEQESIPDILLLDDFSLEGAFVYPLSEIAKLVKENDVESVIISIQNLTPAKKNEIADCFIGGRFLWRGSNIFKQSTK